MKQSTAWVLGGTALLLAACGGSDSSDTQYDNSGAEVRWSRTAAEVAALDAAQFQARLSPIACRSWRARRSAAWTSHHRIRHRGRRGRANQCHWRADGAHRQRPRLQRGLRPVVLYAHGTSEEKPTTFPTSPTPAAPAPPKACCWGHVCAQGFIVVAQLRGLRCLAPGLPPYLNADQSAKEMVDALGAARAKRCRASVPAKTVASCCSRATRKAVTSPWPRSAPQAAGQKVTAAAPMSSPTHSAPWAIKCSLATSAWRQRCSCPC